MPIKNYTTRIDVQISINEISRSLASHGARRVAVDYDGKGRADGVGFDFPVANQPVHFRLPANPGGVLEVLKAQAGVDARHRTMEHAYKVAWRILKDWVLAQMAIVEAGAAQLAEVFLPYALQPDGKTMFEAFVEHQQKLLKK